jgi:putative N6-adenine-specific DNA methylase
MSNLPDRYDFFAAGTPGLESTLAAEMQRLGLADVVEVAGGATCTGTLNDVLRANRQLRTAGRVLVRLASFRAAHLSNLAPQAARVPWDRYIDPARLVRLRCSCRASRIYHSGAATQRILQGIQTQLGTSLQVAPPQDDSEDAAHHAEADVPQQIFIRIERNQCTISLDASGAPLHRRGLRVRSAKAPLRETLAAAFLQQAGWEPGQPLIDPMCGSGTFLLEAGAATANLAAGRGRAFACETWPVFRKTKARGKATDFRSAGAAASEPAAPAAPPDPALWGFDRDAGAIAATQENIARAGLAPMAHVQCQPLKALRCPPGKPGWVICNPPYGQRIGDPVALTNLYASLGNALRGPLAGWSLAFVTSEFRLAAATGLKLEAVTPLIPHGGLKVRLYRYTP